MRGRAMFGGGALLAVALATLGCDSFPHGHLTLKATEEQQTCARALPIPTEAPRPLPNRSPAIHTTVGGVFIFIHWGWQNYDPLHREVQDVVRRVRELRDLMTSQCGVDPSTTDCDAEENVGHLCP